MYSIFIRLCEQHGVRTADVSKATGIAQPTFTAWKKGNYTPKADKLRLIADYFGVSVDYLMTGKDTEKTSTSGTPYYFDDATAQTAQELMTNPGLRVLFDSAKDCTPDDLKMATALLERLKGTDA